MPADCRYGLLWCPHRRDTTDVADCPFHGIGGWLLLAGLFNLPIAHGAIFSPWCGMDLARWLR